MSEPSTDPLVAIAGFGRVLRAAGVGADGGRIAAFTEALGWLDPSRREDVYWAGRITLCADPDDLPRYNAAFEAVFGGASPAPLPPREPLAEMAVAPAPAAGDPDPLDRSEDGSDRERLYASASAVEALRHKDFADLSPNDRAELDRLLAAFTLPGERRPSRRHRPSPRGPIDRRRTVNAALASAGEPARLAHRRPRPRSRRVVLLVDISGSMAPYADALLRFAHAARRGSAPVEVFTLGTRLTRVTRELTHRDPAVAMRAVLAAVPDWSGGTRLGVLLRDFLDTWGQRGLARGAVVVVLSDGWEREDPALLGEQMSRLHRLAHRLVWANPLRDRAGYAPLAAGMAAALPHVDDFVAGHSVAALEELAAVVAGRADTRGRARAAASAGHPMRWGQNA
ncbi:MAG TPA: VWA domain-containing protein [Frankiaceae bacterium]|nr:VWA domain-containing protein [Frankiaceae bacterium]